MLNRNLDYEVSFCKPVFYRQKRDAKASLARKMKPLLGRLSGNTIMSSAASRMLCSLMNTLEHGAMWKVSAHFEAKAVTESRDIPRVLDLRHIFVNSQ